MCTFKHKIIAFYFVLFFSGHPLEQHIEVYFRENSKLFFRNIYIVGIRPLLPDPEPFPQHRHPGDLRYQQQQQEQIQVFRQKQQTNIQPQPPTAAGQFPMNNNFNSNNGRSARSMFPTHQGLHNNLQLPLQQALGLPPTFGRSPQNVAGVNLAAQALVQQQLLERARLFAQAHLMQQQPQVNFFFFKSFY